MAILFDNKHANKALIVFSISSHQTSKYFRCSGHTLLMLKLKILTSLYNSEYVVFFSPFL